jgi:hypothetical protein
MNRTEAFNVFAKLLILIWGIFGLATSALLLSGHREIISSLPDGPIKWVVFILLLPLALAPALVFAIVGHPTDYIVFILVSIFLTGIGIYLLLHKEKLPSPEECDRELDEVERLKREREKQP